MRSRVADMNAIKAVLPGVVAVAGTRSMQTTVVAEGQEHSVALVGATEGFQAIRNLLILQGRFLDADDLQSRSKICLITDELATLAFPNQNPMGARLRVGELSFTVIGVFRERVGTFGLSEIQRYTVLVPFPLMQYYTGDTSIDTLYAQADAPEHVSTLTRAGRSAVAQPASRRDLRGAEPERHPGRSAQYRHGVDHRAAGDRIHRAHGERHRHHEHHAGHGDRDGRGKSASARPSARGIARSCISF